MSFPATTPFEVISLGDISISLARGHYQFASTDYSELPDMLSEVGVPSRGTWTYEKKPGGQYIVTGEMYGQVVRYGAPARKVSLDDRTF
jgi:hypothetical protein